MLTWPLKTKLQLLGAFLLALLAFRGLLAATESWSLYPNDMLSLRLRNSLSAMRAAGREPLVVFAGTSEAQITFDHLAFRKELARGGKEVSAFNLAIQGFGHMLPLYFRRISRELAVNGQRPVAILVNPTITAFTTRALRQPYNSDATAVHSTAFLPSLAPYLNDPLAEAPLLAAEKYLFGERSRYQLRLHGYQLAIWAFSFLHARPLRAGPMARLTTRPFLREWAEKPELPFYRDSPDAVVPDFSRYLGDTPAARAATMMAHREECCDFMAFGLDERYFAMVAAALKDLAGHTDHLVLVDLPENPLLVRTPESAAKRRNAMRRLAAEAGAELWEMPPQPEELFLDGLHLNPRGVAVATKFILEKFPAAWLARPQASR